MEAYAPLNIPNSDLHWSILATRDNSDAFARLGRFSKNLVIAVTAMIFVICVASMFVAQAAVRPVRRLEEAPARSAPATTTSTFPSGPATRSVI